MVLTLPLNLKLDEVELLIFLIIFTAGAYLNWDWAKIAKKYVKAEQQLYHPLIRKYEKASGNVLSFFVEPKPLPFYEYVFGAQTSSLVKKIAWWLRSLFLLGLIAMNWWLVILLLLITRQVPTKWHELISQGIHYKRYDNDFLLNSLAYHLAYIAATILLYKISLFEIIFQQVFGFTNIFGITPQVLYLIMFIWGILYLLADVLTIIISIYDHRRWRTFWLQQFNRYESLKQEFPVYHDLVKSNHLYPVDKKYILGCLINIVLLIVLILI